MVKHKTASRTQRIFAASVAVMLMGAGCTGGDTEAPADEVEAIETIVTIPPDVDIETEEPLGEPAPEETIAEPVIPTAEELEALPTPNITGLLPAGLPTATPDDLSGEVALPVARQTAAYAEPATGAEAVLRLAASTTLGTGSSPARWAVVGSEPGWVKVLLPVGRGALPSSNPAAVNHYAAWVRDTDVVLEEEPNQIVVDVAGRRLKLYRDGSLVKETPVGVGIESETPTPRGLFQVAGHITTQAGANGLASSGQSTVMDGFSGANYAVFAIHEGVGFDTSKGGAVSNGCIRVPASVYQQYFGSVPVGTPIIVI